jgi:hypothetical protein
LEILAFMGTNPFYYNYLSRIFMGHLARDFKPVRIGFNWSEHTVSATAAQNPDEVNSVFSLIGNFSIAGISCMIESALSLEKIRTETGITYGRAINFEAERFIQEKYALKFTGYYIQPEFKSIDSAAITTSGHNKMDIDKSENIIEEKYLLYRNRTGGRLTAGVQLPYLLVEFTYGLAGTISETSNTLAFPHHVSQFDQSSAYNLGLNESAVINSSVKTCVKYFNLSDITATYDFQHLIRQLGHTTITGRAGFNGISINPVISPFASDILQDTYLDLFLSQGITRNIFLIGFFSIEHFSAIHTLPVVDQTDKSYGIGLNLDIYAQTAVYIKMRQIVHTDYSAGSDNDFSGLWASIEVKSYF